MGSRADKAVELFGSGCSCSQAIAVAFAPAVGVDETTARKAATGFSGGMRTGQVCGALSGVILIFGMKFGPETAADTAARDQTYKKVVDFLTQFEKEHGSVLCRELLGFDIQTKDGYKAAKEKGLFKKRCPEFVWRAAELLEGMITDDLTD